MYRISVLSDNQKQGQQIMEWTKKFCVAQGFFPMLELYENLEALYDTAKKVKPSGVIVAISGVAGLNVSEKLRSLFPDSRLIWCSDLDFSLQAFRLRAEYFIKAPPTKEELYKGLSILFNQRVQI